VRLPSALVLLVAASRVTLAGGIGVGDPAPALSLRDWDGKPVTLASYAGKPVVVDFWASWCTTCRAALPALDAVARRQRERGVAVLAVNVDRNRAAADAWLAEHLADRTVTLLSDPEGASLAAFGANGMPAVYVIDAKGIVRFSESGYVPDRVGAVERAVDALSSSDPR